MTLTLWNLRLALQERFPSLPPPSEQVIIVAGRQVPSNGTVSDLVPGSAHVVPIMVLRRRRPSTAERLLALVSRARVGLLVLLGPLVRTVSSVVNTARLFVLTLVSPDKVE